MSALAAPEREFKLVLIEWVDSHSTNGWQDVPGHGTVEDRVLFCRSVGWLIHDGAIAKVVAPHVSESDQMCGAMTIPVTAIRRVTVLSEKGRGLRK